jgi:putative acetyltransferase
MQLHPTISIQPVTTDEDLETFRTLVREYASYIGFDLSFQGFEEELISLPGKYSVDEGGIMVLAFLHTEAIFSPAGCIALRNLDNNICEMKRLFVRPQARGHGIGMALSQELMSYARQLHYTTMRLDTRREAMPEAFKLYTSLGFYEIPAYNENPYADICYMERKL